MRRKSTHSRTPLAKVSDVVKRPRAAFKFGAVALAAAFLTLAGCAKKDPLAGLNELPAEQAKNLRPVADSKRFATQTLVRTPQPDAGPVPPCAKNGSYVLFSERVKTDDPVVECFEPVFVAARRAAASPPAPAAANKLTDFKVFAGVVKDSLIPQTPLLCDDSKGPFPALLTIERGCAGTCSPRNTLQLLDVPNPIIFVWYGTVDKHPRGFEFVGPRTLLDSEDLGQCNGGPDPELP